MLQKKVSVRTLLMAHKLINQGGRLQSYLDSIAMYVCIYSSLPGIFSDRTHARTHSDVLFTLTVDDTVHPLYSEILPGRLESVRVTVDCPSTPLSDCLSFEVLCSLQPYGIGTAIVRADSSVSLTVLAH
jgi:hypothetical protein